MPKVAKSGQTDRPTEFAIALSHLVDTKCHKKQKQDQKKRIEQERETESIKGDRSVGQNSIWFTKIEKVCSANNSKHRPRVQHRYRSSEP